MFERFKKNPDDKAKLTIESSQQPSASPSNEIPRPPAESLRFQDPNLIAQEMFHQVIERLLTHPLFIQTIIKELSQNSDLISTIVKTCFEGFEAKYDITPTQVYRDRIQNSEDSLAKLNLQIEERSQDFDKFQQQIIDFQKQTSQMFGEKLSELTDKMINKFK